jgi:hypothetical protein
MKTIFSWSWRSLLRFCGSVKLAMLLLGVIIIASIAGTLIESRFDAGVAQAYVYDAPWFIAWLILLCVNLIGAVVVRYPWKPHQIGFVITHAGIVVILIGGVIGRMGGIEGNMTLTAGGEPQNFLVVNETILQVQSGHSGAVKTYPVNLDLRPPTSERPLVINKDDLQISVLGFARELGTRTVVERSDNSGVPAIRLVMNSSLMPHAIDQWLVLDDSRRGFLNVGRNLIRFTASEESELEGLAAGSREMHFAFAKMRAMNLSRLIEGGASGAVAEYRFSENPERSRNDLGVLELALDGNSFEILVGANLGMTVPLEGTGWAVRGLQYFADFRMEGKLPVSVSEQPNNPAIIFELIGPPSASGCCSAGETVATSLMNPSECAHDSSEGGECSHGAAGEPGRPHGHGHGHGSGHDGRSGARGHELIITSREGQLHFLSRSEAGETRGEIEPGSGFSPGWEDWVFQVEEFFEQAVVREETGPLSDKGMRSIGASGLLVRVSNESDSVQRWLQMGTTAFVHLGRQHVHMAFGYRIHPLDFRVELERFEVEFNEGTSTPGSFKSHVRFIDPKTGEALRREIWMNNPANFPSFFGAGLLGTSYKFSQSSWNPGNLNQSTLQVIRDPGWSLKWIGSLLFCAGLITIFYIKPYPRMARKKAAGLKASVPRLKPPPVRETMAAETHE